MPGIDGATVIRRIRLDPALRDTPCILMTAADDYATELQMLDAGADAFVRKQQNLAIVPAKLNAVLRQSAEQLPIEVTGSLHGPSKVLALTPDRDRLAELAASLRDEGYDVIPVAQTGDALDLLAAQPVDCIVFGLGLSGDLGRDACRRIKDVPVIGETPVVMTGENDDDMLACLAAGADDYVRSGSGAEALRAHVRTQIRRKQSLDESRRIREELMRRELDAAEERSARQLAETRAALVEELEWRNRELEAFSGSVSHDLRGPLQVISSFAEHMLDDEDEPLSTEARRRLGRIQAAAGRMADLVESLLILARASRGELRRTVIDLTATTWQVIGEVEARDPDRKVAFTVQESMTADADEGLAGVILENLINNAVKFTRKVDRPVVEIGFTGRGFFVRDNGAGFPAGKAGELFRPFARLHSADEFPGTGIGLTTVHRAVERHGGEIWAEGENGRGATFWFTMPPATPPGPSERRTQPRRTG
jgi:signal transduction histidine kinase